MSAVIQNSYIGNGSTTNYSFTFPYLKSTDVQVQVDATVTTAWQFANATTVQFNTAPANGAKIKILRETNVDSLAATFYAGSAIKSEDLNDNYTQNLYKTQEVGQRFFSNTGGTMTGDLTMGEDTSLIFEGATDDGNETTLTVADPTADRTITLPDVTGTVVTTGDTGTVATAMIANDAVTNAKIADDQIDSEHYVDGSIDTQHIADAQITTAKIADSNVTTAKIANDAVTMAKLAGGVLPTDITVASANLVDGTIATADIADAAVTTAKIADTAVTTAKITDANVTTAKIADSNVTTAKIASGNVTTDKLADSNVTTAKIADSNVTTAKIADLNVTTAKIAADAITNAKIADNAVGVEHIADAELTTLAGMQSGTASKLAAGTTLTSDIADLNQIDGLTKQTTITDSDASFPTSGAVVDYVTAQIAPLGGLEVVATEVSFPNTQPQAGVVISISDAGGVVFNGSGTSTTGRTVGGTTVTINNAPSSLNNETLVAGVGLMVSSTGSGQVYNYHKILGKEDDIKQLSDDINDFNARYRIGSSNPTSALDAGDLFFNTSTSKLLVYNATNTAWEEAQSIGNFFISTLSPAFDGSTQDFTITNAPTNAEQILLSINGVIQKPNAGTSTPSEGFALSGSTVKLAAAPASGDAYFAVVIGSTVNIGTPSNNTVSTAIIQNGAVTGEKISTNLDLTDNKKVRFGTGNDLEIYHNGSNSIIRDSGTGNLFIDSNRLEIRNSGGGETQAVFFQDGAVELYYDNQKKAETTATGFSVNGTLVDLGATHFGDVVFTGDAANVVFDKSDNALEFADNAKAVFGAGSDLTISHDGSNSIINDNGTGELQLQRAGNTILTFNDTGISITDPTGGAAVEIKGFEGGNASLKLIADEGDDAGDQWRIQSNATDNNFKIQNDVSGSLANIWQLGTNGNVEQTGNLSIPDDKEIQLGTNDDLTIKHNNTTNKTEFVMSSTKNVKFINGTSDNYFVAIGSHEAGTDDNRQMLQIHANGQRVLHSDINGNFFNYASGHFGRVRTDANSPVNEYRNAPHSVNIYSGNTADPTNFRANLKLCSADFLTAQGDSSIIYFTDSGADNTSVDYDQDQKFSVKQNGTTEAMTHVIAGRVKSDERTNANVVYGNASIYMQQSYNQNIFNRIRTRNTDNTDDILFMDTGGGVVIKFESQGNGRFDGGADVGNASDYAEYFEWADGNTSSADRRGITVVMDGEKIKPATDSDDKSKIIGVVSANPAVVGDSAWSEWQAAHKKDAYGSWATEDKEYLIWNDFCTNSTTDDKTKVTNPQPDINDPNVTSDYQILVSDIDAEKAAGRCPQAAIDQNLRITRPSRVYNESYDPSKTYVPRSARKEWDAIGLVGKLVVRRGQPVGTNWILMKSNVGVDPTDNSIVLDKYLVR